MAKPGGFGKWTLKVEFFPKPGTFRATLQKQGRKTSYQEIRKTEAEAVEAVKRSVSDELWATVERVA